MPDELPVEADSTPPEDTGGLPVNDFGDEPEEPTTPLSDKQKMLFFAFVLVGMISLAAISSNFSNNVTRLNETPTPEVTPTDIPTERYSDKNIGISFGIPPEWIIETPGSISNDFIALKPEGDSTKCFPDITACPIVIERKENSRGAPPSQFGTPFYPAIADIRGGQDTVGVGGYNATVLFNIRGNGGRIIYIQREWDIIKLTLQEGSAGQVILAESDIFDKFVSSINFTQ